MFGSLLPSGLALLSVGEFFSDMMLVLKIFVLLAIISFVLMHLGKGPLSIVLILGISWFVLFDYFWFFGGVYMLLMLLTFGVAGILVDFFFVFPGFAGGGGQTPESKVGSVGGLLARQQQFGPHAPPGGAGGRARMPPPM